MSYGQYMKHWKNHRKDRFYQQCSGYGGSEETKEPMTNEEWARRERESFERLIESAKDFPFPAHIFRQSWCWRISDKPNLFSEEIGSYEELLEFGEKYVG